MKALISLGGCTGWSGPLPSCSQTPQDRFSCLEAHFTVIFQYLHFRSNPLKGTATLIISMFYQKELCEPRILIQASSKLVEKWASYGLLKNSIWPTFSRHFEYLNSFQNFFNCFIFSYHYYQIICVSADM